MAGNLQHPFQCVQFIERQANGLQDLLVASAGSRIYSYAVGNGQRLAVWPENAGPFNSENVGTTGPQSSSDGQAPPEKKRKVSPGNEKNEDSKSATESSGKSQLSVTWSTVPVLVPSSDGQYMVALTGEDKTIRVLKVAEDGTLEQLSAR